MTSSRSNSNRGGVPHEVGIAATVAIAVASFYVTRLAQWKSELVTSDLLGTVYHAIPDSEVRNGIKKAKELILSQ